MVRFVKRRVQWESEVVTMDQSLVNACRLGYAASVYDRFRVHRYRRPLTTESETQLQQSRSQFASCLAKRLNGKGVTRVLMAAGNDLDPVYDSLAPWSHARTRCGTLGCRMPPWPGASKKRNMSSSTMLDLRLRSRALLARPLRQSSNTIPSFGACMHDGRIVDPTRRACTSC